MDADTLALARSYARRKIQEVGSAGGAIAGVSSFNGRTGAVTPEKNDYTPEQVGADPSGSAEAALTAAKKHADGLFGALADGITLNSSTEGSAKQFRLRADDDGRLVVEEIA